MGNTPLHLAAQYGRTEVADFLIQEGAKVDTRWEHLWMTGYTIYALIFHHPKYSSFATEGYDSVLIDDEI